MYLEKPKLHNLEDYLLATFFFNLFVLCMVGIMYLITLVVEFPFLQ